jgi:CheY-like chemotaxis protein
MRVLCVDDDRVTLLLFEMVCTDVGDIDLRCVEDAEQALTAVAGWRPDLMVIDLHLRDIDGYTLRPRLQATLGEPPVPAVLYTAEMLQNVQDEAQAAGFSHVWNKPIGADELRSFLLAIQAARRPDER